MSESSGRVAALDGVRGLAILLVIAFHYGWGFFRFEPGSLGAYAVAPMRLMWSGVDLFFVLSGFVIARQLLRHREASNYFTAFYGRRVLRIIPLYIVLLACFVTGVTLQRAGVLDLPQLFGAADHLWTYAVFAQNIAFAVDGPQITFLSVSWSLAIEAQFYLAFPLIVRIIRSRLSLAVVLVGAVIIAPMVRYILAEGWGEAGVKAAAVLPFTRMDSLALGALIALIESTWPDWLADPRAPWLVGVTLILGGVGLAIELEHQGILGVGLYSVLSIFYGSLVASILVRRLPMARLFETTTLRYCGKISYCLYLVHLPLLGLVLWLAGSADLEIVGSKPAWVTLVALGSSIAVAALSLGFFEGPLVKYARRRFGFQRPNDGRAVIGRASDLQAKRA